MTELASPDDSHADSTFSANGQLVTELTEIPPWSAGEPQYWEAAAGPAGAGAAGPTVGADSPATVLTTAGADVAA